MNKQKICLLLCSIRNVLVIICHILNKYKLYIVYCLKINISYHWKVTNIGVSSLSVEEKVVTLRRLLTKSDRYVSLKNVLEQ